MQRIHRTVGLGSVLLLSTPSFAQVVAPCLETAQGADLFLGDDEVAQGLPLGFAFPFAGGTVRTIGVSSNGFVWLQPSTNNGCCNGDAAAFVAEPARIAPLWTDLNPGAAGRVRFATFPGRAVVTWDQVVEFGQPQTMTFQLQLLSDGSFIVYWDQDAAVAGHSALVGVTPGNAASAVSVIDYSTALPFQSGANGTIYELFPAGTLDLRNRALRFVPNGVGGYDVSERSDCQFAAFSAFGVGCPVPPTAYERFAPGAVDLSGLAFDFVPAAGGGYEVSSCTSNCLDAGYANGTNLNLGDDAIAVGVSLGFTFPYHGGATSSIDVSSNGCVYLQSNTITDARCCDGDVGRFLAEAASIAVLWQDLVPSATNAVRTHRPNASTFVITYDAVPEAGVPGSANTAQLQLFSNGRFRLAYGAVANAAHTCLTGFTPGGGTMDPGSVDLGSAVPFSTGTGGTPVLLYGSAGTRPSIGSSFTMIVGNAPAGSSAGVLLFGYTMNSNGIALGGIGMPGCRLHVSSDAALPFAVQGSFSQVTQALPNSPPLIGVTLYLQAALVANGVNPLGIVVSNAARMELGN